MRSRGHTSVRPSSQKWCSTIQRNRSCWSLLALRVILLPDLVGSPKEATEANSKLMAAIINALLESGVAQRDVQTSRFSIQPIYAPQEPRDEPKLAGYSVSNQVRLKIRQIHKVGEILDRLVTAGATDIGNVEFLVSEPSKALDQAREAAIA